MLLAALQLSRPLRWAAAAALVLAAGVASAQVNLVVTVPPTLGTPPVANAVTRGQASSVTFNANNTRASTLLRQFQVRLPFGYTVTGGQGPAGWTVTGITNGSRTITFRVTDCAVGGIASGATGAFRVNATAPNTTLASDTTDSLSTIAGTDPCPGGTASGWTETATGSITWARKTLLVTGSVSPGQGAPPLAATATYNVTNLSSGTRTVTPSSAVAPGTGWTGGTCTPANRSLTAGSSGSFTCAYTLSTPGAYTFAGSATGTSTTSAVGAVVGTVEVGAATATFAFDALFAGVGDQVRATMTVHNQGATTITATPPTYAQLVLQNLARASGTVDPSGESIPAGGTADFVYLLDVTGVVGATYVAQGTASTTIGNTNLAVTPVGTVSASRVEWTPPAVVKARTASPYNFTVTVTNGSATAVSRINVVNPQNGSWTAMSNVSATGITYTSVSTNGATTTLRYDGSVAAGATATLRFRFTAVPTVTQTTGYPFQVQVYQGGSLITPYSFTASVAVPIPDVAKLSIASSAGGQVLAWVNTSATGAEHDGVVVFRTAAPGVPTVPADFVDYGVPANQPADFFFEDGEGSVADTLADPAVGAYNYRVCNRDALFVYSSCNSGFWSGAGWLDSAVAPTGGWTHQLGGSVLTMPGVVPGSRVAVATNAPSIGVLDTATGDRSFDPAALVALPSNGTPVLPLGDGRNVVFAADSAGNVTALDIGTGVVAWQVNKAGESFVAGVSAILRQFAAPAFQAAYPTDVLLLPSTTGRVLAVNATTGATLWTLDAGTAVRAGTWHDSATNRLFVATDGGGVRAYDLATSNPTTAPSLAAGFVNPGGTYRLACVRAPATTDFACVDTVGTLRVLDKATGAVKASLATGASAPTGIVRTTTTPGFVVSSASRVVRVLATGATPVLSTAGFWAPGLTLSPANVFQSGGSILVAASDRRVHKLLLSDASDTGVSVLITPQPASVLLGPPAVDTTSNLLYFGTNDGRLWAVPLF